MYKFFVHIMCAKFGVDKSYHILTSIYYIAVYPDINTL